MPGETVVVVAEINKRILYYDDVEEGWELECPSATGGVDSRFCNQYELSHVMYQEFGDPDKLCPFLSELKKRYNLVIDSPFTIQIGGETFEFEYRIHGYGARHGMIIDKDWSKIEPVAEKLGWRGFGFSCFDLNVERRVDGDVDSFQEVLDDWGKTNT